MTMIASGYWRSLGKLHVYVSIFCIYASLFITHVSSCVLYGHSHDMSLYAQIIVIAVVMATSVCEMHQRTGVGQLSLTRISISQFNGNKLLQS